MGGIRLETAYSKLIIGPQVYTLLYVLDRVDCALDN
jgi:hypothetical protein